MTKFVQGQRWVVDSEPELGLGTVTAVSGRTVNMYFEQGDCERCYSAEQAPLTRIKYSLEDEIQSADGSTYTISAVHEQEGLIIYDTTAGQLIPETSLSSHVKLNQPYMRLMTGQLDKPKWFFFKRQLDADIGRVWQSRLNGLLGARATLVPHQLYVAWSACNREKVRVLLADEVGLGKTIEAGLILSRLLRQERISRALILVPDALQVQWLVELARKFNIKTELYAGIEHDFNSGQIHIVPHSAIESESERFLEAGFELTIVDEAHNIQDSLDAFSVLEQLAAHSPHMVLLTATPEQLGIKSHFERLRLLDPAKFSDFDAFIEQEKHYATLNEQIQKFPEGKEKLVKQYQLTPTDNDDELLEQVLDCHGIGRMMFRNVRKAVAGFPQRIAHSHIVANDSWQDKYEWLAQWLETNDHKKVLVITHDIQHVFECEQYLWNKHGIDAAVFHEEQSLIDRDRAAAYFSDMEGGSRILICSEIGSEGRNFQFCNQLICLDLPEHPDMLEQRIGRLDRIGQQHDVNIHTPIAQNSDSQQLYSWYHNSLNCIEQQNPAAGTIHNKHWETYQASPSQDLLKTVQQECKQLRDDIENGRDALLEMNSCRQPQADELTETINAFEQTTPHSLVELASDLLQFHFEETRSGAYNLIPSDKMLIPALPGIPPEGIEVTFNRDIANSREDIIFLTWDSPFIHGLWELLHHSELGSASVATLPSRQLPAGHCLLETCFDVVVQSESSQACRQFFPSLSVRSVVLDVSDKDLSAALSEESLQNTLTDVKKYIAREVIQSKKDDIPAWFKKGEAFAEQQLDALLGQARTNATQFYSHEINRLKRLNELNSGFSSEEIISLTNKSESVINAIDEHTHLRLAAIRLIVVTEPQ